MKRRRGARALLAAALLTSALAGCREDGSSVPSVPAPVAVSSIGPTPDPLRHPCAALPASTAGRLLGVRVVARHVHDPLSGRALTCAYTGHGVRLQIRSTPDPTPIGRLVGLYVGTDRLLHHPVAVPGADAAELVELPAEHRVTLLAKQGYVTHLLVLSGLPSRRADRLLVALTTTLVAAEH
jgi:hypothetical protein